MTFAEFLEQYAVLISVTLATIILVLVILFLIVPRFTKKDEVMVDAADFFQSLGGKENVKDLTIRGSRVTVVLIDPNNINREQLKKHGVSRVIFMDEKVVLLVEQKVKEMLQKLL